MSDKEAAAFALSKVGQGYIYGAKGQVCTEKFRRQQANQYPDQAKYPERGAQMGRRARVGLRPADPLCRQGRRGNAAQRGHQPVAQRPMEAKGRDWRPAGRRGAFLVPAKGKRDAAHWHCSGRWHLRACPWNGLRSRSTAIGRVCLDTLGQPVGGKELFMGYCNGRAGRYGEYAQQAGRQSDGPPVAGNPRAGACARRKMVRGSLPGQRGLYAKRLPAGRKSALNRGNACLDKAAIC